METHDTPTSLPDHSGRRVLLAGATGLVGRELLRLLLEDPTVAIVHTFGRRPADLEHSKLNAHVVDFAALPPLPPVDEAYLALGTTIKVAGSQAAFRAVDFEANLAMARAAVAAGARRIGLVSAMGADARSSVFYSGTKGELEEALGSLALDALVIARPSLLLGDRTALGQPTRTGERIGQFLSPILRFILPANFRPITAYEVARALTLRVPLCKGREILPSGALATAAK